MSIFEIDRYYDIKTFSISQMKDYAAILTLT